MADERIILVDDDELILRSLGQILRLEGYVVETAETGGEAMEKIEEAPPTWRSWITSFPTPPAPSFSRSLAEGSPGF